MNKPVKITLKTKHNHEYDKAVKIALKTRRDDEDVKTIIDTYNNSQYKLARDVFNRNKQSIMEKLRKAGI